MGRKTVARRRFLSQTVDPLTPSPTPTPPPSPPRPFAPSSPPPQPSPPPSPPPPPPQPTPPPSPPKPSTSTKRRFKPFVSKNSTTKSPSTTAPKPRKPVTRSAKSPAPKSTSAATTSTASPSRKRKASTSGKSSSKKPKGSSVKILSGRIFPTTWVSRPEFKFLLDALQSQGWVSLLNYNEGFYESEIHQFYANLSIDENLVLSTVVNDVGISLTVIELGPLLGVPTSGFSDLPHQSWPLLSGIDNATISRTLSGQPSIHAQIFSVSHLSAQNKLLRNLVTKFVLPRIENRGECLIMDQVLLWLLIHGIPISLPHLMVLHMKNLSHTPLYYPYGLWLTKIFDAFDVLIPNSKGVTSSDEMNDGVLSKMDLCVLDGELLKKDFRGLTPKEACKGCLKMMEYMRDMQKQMQQLVARQRASDTLAAQRHRQLMSKP